MQDELIYNNMLFVIPSWGQLLGYPTLGTYANQNVSKILSDLVIFLGGIESSVKTDKGTIYYLFGLGYYFLKFELRSGSYITDNRQLTGLILSDFVYDHLATSNNITLEDDRDIIIAENLIKVPIDLSNKSNNKRTFIKGSLMRNVFIPYKDVFLEMMETIKNPDSYQIETNGHMLLSTHWDSYNKILISPDMDYNLKVKYLKETAGLNGIMSGAETHLIHYFSDSKLNEIIQYISYLKRNYSTIDYDPMYLFSIIDKASKILAQDIFHTHSYVDSEVPIKMPKESIFISAENRMNTFIEWPERFQRKTREKLESLMLHVSELKEVTTTDKPTMSEPILERNNFELRTMKSDYVENKILPKAPQNDIINILFYLKNVILDDYDMPSIGNAFEIARDNLNRITLHLDFQWEMSKIANIYKKKELNLGLSPKEKNELLEKVNNWIDMILKNEIKIIPKEK